MTLLQAGVAALLCSAGHLGSRESLLVPEQV